METSSSNTNNSRVAQVFKSLKTPLKAVLILFVIFILAGGVILYKQSKEVGQPIVTTVQVKKYNDIVRQSTTGGDVKPLQNYLIDKLKDKKNDEETKSAIYWITHRYFDNGGNFYEIYDFVQAHKELSFFNSAEAMYPDIFKKIKNREVGNYSVESLQALLAYYDVIDQQGYASMTLWGIAANKYSELAMIADTLKNSKGEKLSKNDARLIRGVMADKAMHYIQKTDAAVGSATVTSRDLNSLLNKGTRDEDVLVALNQYASAIQNMKSIGFRTAHPFSVLEIYEFNNTLAQTKVGRLYFFTSYLYATSLINAKEATKESVKVPLERIVAYVQADPSTLTASYSSVARVLNAKVAKESSVYSLENVKKLASLNKTFKDWLIQNGWSEADFK